VDEIDGWSLLEICWSLKSTTIVKLNLSKSLKHKVEEAKQWNFFCVLSNAVSDLEGEVNWKKDDFGFQMSCLFGKEVFFL
jgi:hypothetical protein